MTTLKIHAMVVPIDDEVAVSLPLTDREVDHAELLPDLGDRPSVQFDEHALRHRAAQRHVTAYEAATRLLVHPADLPAVRIEEGVLVGEEIFISSLDCAESDPRFAIGNIRGALVESRIFSVAMHHRLVDAKDMPRLREAFDEVARRHPELKAVRGKRAQELLAQTEWDRGRAVELVIAKLRLRDILPVYIGDDRTDEAASRQSGNEVSPSWSPRTRRTRQRISCSRTTKRSGGS